MRGGAMLEAPTFTLNEALSSVEFMAPKMDAGCGVTDASLRSLPERLVAGTVPSELSLSEVLAIADALLAAEARWLNGASLAEVRAPGCVSSCGAVALCRRAEEPWKPGNTNMRVDGMGARGKRLATTVALQKKNPPLACFAFAFFLRQTVFTCLYLHDLEQLPAGTGMGVLHTLATGLLKTIDVVATLVSRADVYEEEDFVTERYRFYCCELEEGDAVVGDLLALEQDLDARARADGVAEGEAAVLHARCARLQFRRAFLRAHVALDDNRQDLLLHPQQGEGDMCEPRSG